MDPITTAIVAALPVLASDLVKQGVMDAYEGLKAVIQRKWGKDSDISVAITDLETRAGEKKPVSKARVYVLSESVQEVGATEDKEVLTALHTLVEEMKTDNVGGEAVAAINFTMSGGEIQGVAGAGNVNIGSMNFGVSGYDDKKKS